MKVHLLVIDPQQDFCDPNGSLFVPGADKDMDRLAAMVLRLKGKLDDISVTLDSHRKVDIAHPIWLLDENGDRPSPFNVLGLTGNPKKASYTLGDGTVIEQQVPGDKIVSVVGPDQGKIYRTRLASYMDRTLMYLNALTEGARYGHTVWPEHCLIGSEGHKVRPAFFDACAEWEEQFALTEYVTKGSNMWTEHFSGVRAEVPDPEDPTTLMNTELVQRLADADIIALAGEALSHCMANTVTDIADKFGDENVKKMVLLTDATSSVPNPPGTTLFTDLADKFMADLTRRGMQTNTTVDFLS